MKVFKSALIGAAALLSTGVFASNMGFKLVYPLYASTGGTNGGYNWVSLPYFNSFVNAMDVVNDINNTGSVTGQVLEVDLYDRATDSYLVQDGFSTDFAIPKGAAIRVLVAGNTNWTIVGSHDNAFAVALNPSTGGTNGGFNWVSLPYHTNKTTSLTLYNEIDGGSGQILEVDVYDRATDSYLVQDGFSADFPITIGSAILVKTTTLRNWTPAHY